MRKHPVSISRRSFLKAGAAAAAAAALSTPAHAAAPAEENCLSPQITTLRATRHGPVQGLAQGKSLVWYGIPYGAAPTGELRWHAPADPAPWSAARDCTTPAAVACQYSGGVIGTEDCLKLDVYTTPAARRLPVMVYLHGGGNQSGSTQELSGAELTVQAGCVFVAVGYRLGLFGFNCLPALHRGADSTGNFALLDIAKALDWVRDNIAQFGGDPNNVTVAGFSAGGRNVMAMLKSPLFAGRFHKAISFSGGMTVADETAGAQAIAAALAPLAVEDGLFGSASDAQNWLLTDGVDVRDWLYSLDAEEICPRMAGAGLRMSAFPHLYGDGVVLPADDFAGAQSPYNRVPLLLLTGSTEFSLFAAWDSYFESDEMQGYSAAEVQAAKQFVVTYGSELYRIFNAEDSAETLGSGYGEAVYLCQVDYGAPDSLTPIPTFGSFHGVCLPMLSSVNGYTLYHDFSNAGYQAMAAQFRHALKNFLACGDPNGAGGLLSGLQDLWDGAAALPAWRRWTPEDKCSMVLDASATAAAAECRDVSSTYEAVFAKMDADTSLSDELKQKMICHVLNGRFFSAALDAHYGNPAL